MPTLNDVLAGSQAQAVQVQQIVDALKGTPNKGVPIALVSLNDPNNYALTVQNDDPVNSRALSVLKADGTTLISADATGVALGAPVSLPVGTVTSSMIADGTIATADIAANACTQTGRAVGSTSSPTTTSTTYADLPDMSVTLTTVGGDLLVWLVSTVSESTGFGDACSLAVSLDASAEVGEISGLSTINGAQLAITVVARFTGVAAGSHTIKGRWKTTGGTYTATATRRTLLVEELKK